jgi:EAL domain-containing protein (putative c-di-GMP-specific phosphodiesterase class I)
LIKERWQLELQSAMAFIGFPESGMSEDQIRELLKRAEVFDAQWEIWPVSEDVTPDPNDALANAIAYDFGRALAQRQLSVQFQPIVRLSDSAIVGFEPLMRWTDPAAGEQSPAVFIPVAEEKRLIVHADKWVLEQACTALKQVEEAVRPDRELFMSVNFSGHDFMESDFVATLLDTAERAGIAPRQLVVEITERVPIHAHHKVRGVLESCRAAGVRMALDNFGTGYSSLRYLHEYPVDTVKIHRSFVRAMHTDARSIDVVRSIVGLAKNLNLAVTAVGVETVDEARALTDVGCDLAQGFHFGRPMGREALITHLRPSP